jgi:hypothetical protein
MTDLLRYPVGFLKYGTDYDLVDGPSLPKGLNMIEEC